MSVISKAAAIGGIILLASSLAACSGEPGTDQMKQAIRNNQQFMTGLTMMLSSGMAAPGSPTDIDSLMDAAVIEKGDCTNAQNAPGYVCDVRLGLDTNGQKQFGGWIKARFYEANGWQLEEVQ